MMTEKQKRFVDEYIIDLNATRAYRAAYPRVKSDSVAAQAGSRMLRNVKVAEYIENRLKELEDAAIAKQDEVLKYLTSVMRREHKEIVVVTLNRESSFYAPDENGTMRKNTRKEEVPELVEIPAKLSDANKAAELLGKRYGLYTDKLELDGDLELNITVDYGDG